MTVLLCSLIPQNLSVLKIVLKICTNQWNLNYEALLFICDLHTVATQREYILSLNDA